MKEINQENKLSDVEIFRQFENTTLPAADFDHYQHVRMGWIYLQKYEILEALERFPAALKRYAEANGAKNRYHETVTWAYLFIINERIARTGKAKNWNEFSAENQDLLIWQGGILSKYYRDETVKSDLAKKVFLFPDRFSVEQS